MYKIADLQIHGRYFGDGAVFKTKKEIREQLIDFHLVDCEEPKLFKKLSLSDILVYGGWAIEKI